MNKSIEEVAYDQMSEIVNAPYLKDLDLSEKMPEVEHLFDTLVDELVRGYMKAVGVAHPSGQAASFVLYSKIICDHLVRMADDGQDTLSYSDRAHMIGFLKAAAAHISAGIPQYWH